MKTLLAIETSCDETGISIIKAQGNFEVFSMEVLADNLLSQIDAHKEYGGVYPTVARREHAHNIIPLLIKTLDDAGMLKQTQNSSLTTQQKNKINTILEREPELAKTLIHFLETHTSPNIDAIAVTHGPGLAPALWIGVNVASALAIAWDKPLVPVNHMEGHALSALLKSKDKKHYNLAPIQLPALALLISGGHTEIDLIQKNGVYKTLGSTLDDAVGEAFDKVARLLDLPYPGGPHIDKLATEAKKENLPRDFTLPRPMLRHDNLDFSFSGLKTAVLMITKRNNPLTDIQKKQLAREFVDASAEVLAQKLLRAIKETQARTILIGGGVSASTNIHQHITDVIAREYPNITIHKPHLSLTGDNALMIATAGYFQFQSGNTCKPEELRAETNLSLESTSQDCS